MGDRNSTVHTAYPGGPKCDFQYELIRSSSPTNEASQRSSESDDDHSSLVPSDLDDSTQTEPASLISTYTSRMTTVVRTLFISLLAFVFLTILLHIYLPRNMCPVFYYVFLGYWLWLSVLIIGGQLVHLYFL